MSIGPCKVRSRGRGSSHSARSEKCNERKIPIGVCGTRSPGHCSWSSAAETARRRQHPLDPGRRSAVGHDRALGNPEIQTPAPRPARRARLSFHQRLLHGLDDRRPCACRAGRCSSRAARCGGFRPIRRAKTPPAGRAAVAVAVAAPPATRRSIAARSAIPARFGNAAFDTNIETEGRTATSATENADHAIEFLRSHDGKRPFFMYLRRRCRTIRAWRRRVRRARTIRRSCRCRRTSCPSTRSTTANCRSATSCWRRIRARPRRCGGTWPTTTPRSRTSTMKSAACSTSSNDAAGRTTRSSIFSSDQGLAVGGRHGLMGKQNLYEHVKSPLVIWPGRAFRTASPTRWSTCSTCFPRSATWPARRRPAVVEGQSLLPIIQGSQTKVPRLAVLRLPRLPADDPRRALEADSIQRRGRQATRNCSTWPTIRTRSTTWPTILEFAAERARLETAAQARAAQFGDPVDFDRPVASGRSRPVSSRRFDTP